MTHPPFEIAVKPAVRMSDRFFAGWWSPTTFAFTLGVATDGRHDEVLPVGDEDSQDPDNHEPGDVAPTLQQNLKQGRDVIILTGRVQIVEGRASRVILRWAGVHVQPSKADTTRRQAEANDPRLLHRLQGMALKAVRTHSERYHRNIPGLAELGR